MKYSWRRFRKCVKQCQDPQMYEYIVSQLCMYLTLEEAGKLKIYYADESGFSLDPCIPYGWQPSGEYVRIIPASSPRMNVFGLMSTDCALHAYSVTGSINTETVIAFMDEFVKTVTVKTVVVLDNASIHHSKKFNAKLGEWLQKGLRIFHLPAYSPHLNRIETLWRKIKYDWLKPGDYQSWDTMKKALDEILASVGQNLKIEFDELEVFKKYKKDRSVVYLE